MQQTIERFLVSELDTIDQLRGKCYPVAAPVGDEENIFCIYTRISGDVQSDLSGEPVFYNSVYRLDLVGEDTDELFSVEQVVLDILRKNNVAFEDMHIFSASAVPGAPDGFDLSIASIQRSLTYSVTYWR